MKIQETVGIEEIDKYSIPQDIAQCIPVTQGLFNQMNTRDRLTRMAQLKHSMEQYMSHLEDSVMDPLNEFNVTGLHDSVLTRDGFPRSDIRDLNIFLQIKKNWNTVHYDYIFLQNVLLDTLNEHHKNPVEVPLETPAPSQAVKGFLKISEIVKGCSVDLAGVKENDIIISITTSNETHWDKKHFDKIVEETGTPKIIEISKFFKGNLDKKLVLEVLSSDTVHTLEMTPTMINGTMLGCKITFI